MFKNYILKIFGHVGCVVGRESILYRESRIINNLNIKENIKIGDHTHIKGELLVFGHGGKITVGNYCYVGEQTRIWSAKNIKIGNRVLISHGCNIFDNDTHPIDPVKRHEQFKQIIKTGQPREIDLKEEEVDIADDVMIGAGAIILKDVKIGQGSIVGAGSVVTKNVLPFTIVAGNPAKFIRDIKHI
jgi:acetyltransferase-like isoleucine patch superfamily enzyme